MVILVCNTQRTLAAGQTTRSDANSPPPRERTRMRPSSMICASAHSSPS